MKKFFTHWTVAFVTLFVLSFIGLQDPQIKEIARLKSFDLLLQSEPKEVSNNIAVVSIDEKAIEKYGQWPWNREVLSDIIINLRQNNVGVIVLPILFSEPDRLGGDVLFSDVVQEFVVIGQVGTTQTNKNAVNRGVGKVGSGNDPLDYMFEWPGMLGPIPELGKNASGVGVLNTAPEVDGVTRRAPLIMRVGDETYPAIALEVLRVANGQKSYRVKTDYNGIIALSVRGFKPIYTDQHGRIWLRWNKEYETISAADIDNFDRLQGKTVIIGMSAEGLGGIMATPVGERYSYELGATTIETLLNPDRLVRHDLSLIAELAIAFLVASVIIILVRFGPYWLIGLSIIGSGVILIYAQKYIFTNYNLLTDVSWPLFVLTIVGFHSVFNRFILEFFEKQKIKKQFAGYTSPTVVKMLQENPSLIKDGMKKEISICFSDLRGFTPLGESFGDDVKGLTKLMNGYMDAITEPVLDAKGMIIKYIGDASMHIHNAPIDDPQHPKSAVQTGLNMLKAVEQFNKKITSEGRPPIGMGAGINTGLGYLGEMGSTKRHSYDVLGDAVSTAARIESKCKEYGCLLLVGENTYEATKDDFFYLKIDDLAVKGKTVGITIYTVLCDMKYMMNNTNWGVAESQHIKMHNYYQKQNFDNAIRLCNDLKNEFDGRMKNYYDMWIERCEYMKTQQLPKDWNGVFIATTK